MKSILDRYLDRVLVYANKPEAESEAIRKELKDHLLQKVDDLGKKGMSREEAVLEALRRHGSPKVVGYGLRGSFRWLDVRSYGTARGVIAVGPRAVGIIAFGNVAVGVVACGAFSFGIFSAGFLALGLVWAWAFLGIGGVATSFCSAGVAATGAAVIGVVVQGDVGMGLWAPPTKSYSGVVSHYTTQNVPPFLRSLDPLLNESAHFARHVFEIALPIYVLFVLTFVHLQYRERRRVTSPDDWIIDG